MNTIYLPASPAEVHLAELQPYPIEPAPRVTMESGRVSILVPQGLTIDYLHLQREGGPLSFVATIRFIPDVDESTYTDD